MRRYSAVLAALVVGLGVAAVSSPTWAAASGRGGRSKASSGGQHYKGVTLKVANCCGVWDTATSAGVDKRFEKLTGAKIAYTAAYAEQLAPQVIAAHGKNPPYDVVFTDDQTQTELAHLHLIDKYNPATLQEAKYVTLPALNPGYPPGVWLYYVGFAYNTQEFTALGIPKPTSWSDLFNPKLAGHVSIPALSTPQGFQAIAGAAAASGHKQYDLAAGIDKLATLKLYDVYTSSSQYQTDLADGNTWLTVAADGRSWQLADAGKPINFVVPTIPGTHKKGYFSREFVDITKGTPHLKLAEIYQRLASDAVTQDSVALGAGYSPILQSAINTAVKRQPKWGKRWPTLSTVARQYSTLNWKLVLPKLQLATDLFARTIT